METLQPDIYLGNLRISEPMIGLTGLLMALLCGYAWQRLRLRAALSPPQRWMLRFFGLMAISSMLGAVFGHFFYYKTGFAGKYASWSCGILSLGALAQAAIEHAHPWLSKQVRRNLTVLNCSTVLLALGLAGYYRMFYWVEVHSALALLGLFAPLEFWMWKNRQDPGSRLLLWALIPAVLAVVPHLLKWSPHTWFSYFDVGHMLLLGSFWLMLRGAESIETS